MTFFKKICSRLIVIGLLVSLPVTGFLACTGPSRIESPGEDKSEEKGPDEEVTPPISIPAPPLPLIKNEKILIATMDSESRNPVIAFPSAIDVSEMNDADGDGYVDDIRMVVTPETSEETDLASLHSCPIKTDGSAECYPVGDNGVTYCVYLTDGTNKLTEPFCEDPNVNVVWNGKPVKDIVKAPDHPYLGSTYHVLTDTHISTISKTEDPEDPAMIWGDFADDYKHSNTAEGAEEIAFDGAIDTLAKRIPTEGISLWTSAYDPGSLAGTLLDGLDVLISDTGILTDLGGRRKFSQLKYSSDGKLRFGIENVEISGDSLFNYPDLAYIYIYNTPDTPGGYDGNIKFLDDDCWDWERVCSLLHKKTLTFDVTDNFDAIVVFKAVQVNWRRGGSRPRRAETVKLIMGNWSYRIIGYPYFSGIPDDYDFKDLQIYHENAPHFPSPAEPGKALLLESLGSRIGVVEYNSYVGSPNYVGVTNWIGLGYGKNPQSFVLNSDKTKAYILNQGDNTISILDLTPDIPIVESQIFLADLIYKKELTIKPTKILMSPNEENLVVGTEDLRSTLLIPIDMAIPISELENTGIEIDPDYDGVLTDDDNCPDSWNPSQEDLDGDSLGDECDGDKDNDGIENMDDNCELISNPNQEDADGDEIGNFCERDWDEDGVIDDYDNCIYTENPEQSDLDEDGRGDVCDGDSDGDGLDTRRDNCPNVANRDQVDSDRDGIGDVCDNCPDLQNWDQANIDGDTLGNSCDTDMDGDEIINTNDNCPYVSNSDQLDSDENGTGDVCESDSDGDDIDNDNDNCEYHGNPDQVDTDEDGIGDTCDNCPTLDNEDQANIDGDIRGDRCDRDRDGDGIRNSLVGWRGPDNCPDISNSDQTDSDGDEIGNVCDDDRDGDDVLNTSDNCPDATNPDQEDIDGDGIGDACDESDDSDPPPLIIIPPIYIDLTPTPRFP